jgi:hypothetical protein
MGVVMRDVDWQAGIGVARKGKVGQVWWGQSRICKEMFGHARSGRQGNNKERKKMESKITAELKKIAAKHGGKLYPRDVVEEARNPESPLHNSFEWDDTAAAEQWRIEQARRLIQVSVTVLEGRKEPIRAFVSLTTDRKDGGGYLLVEKVLSNKKQKEQMLKDAAMELEIFTAKYNTIQELSEVNTAAKKFLKTR